MFAVRLSIQIPGTCEKLRRHESLFRDWVVLFIKPQYLAITGTGFCARNAAAGRGRCVGFDLSAFEGLYARRVLGAGDKMRARTPKLLQCCPTDEQAEVLVPDQIQFADIIQVAVRSEAQAQNEFVRLQLASLPADVFTFVIAPDLFDPYTLSAVIHDGRRPTETIWKPK